MAQTTSIKHKGWKWSTADASNPTLVMVLDNTSKTVHITDAADASTDWAVNAASHPTVYIHSATTPETYYIRQYHDGTYGYYDIGGTTVFTATTSALAVALATTFSSTVALSDNVTFATNKKLYFRSTANYICSTETNVIDIYSGTQCVIRSPACVVVGAFTAVSTSIFNDAITIADDKKLYFDDTNAYIQASSSGNLALWASATIYLTAAQGIWVFNNITVDGQTRIRLGTQAGGGTYICSHTTGGVIIVANSALSNAIILQTNEGGSIQLAGYLLLDTIATEGTVTGQMWFCTDSGGVIEYYANSAKRTLQYTEP